MTALAKWEDFYVIVGSSVGAILLQKRGRKLGEVDLAAMDEIWNRVKASPQEAHGSRNLSVSGHICLASHREVREHTEVKRKSGSLSDVSARLEMWKS